MKPKVIITIGYQELLLPDDTGISTIMKALSGAVKVHSYSHRGEIEILEPIRVGMEYVPNNTKYTIREDCKEDMSAFAAPPKRLKAPVLRLR